MNHFLKTDGKEERPPQQSGYRGNSMAEFSLLVAGIAWMIFCIVVFSSDWRGNGASLFLLSWGSGILTVVLGHWALLRMRWNRAAGGRRVARAGLWLGYPIVLFPFAVILLHFHPDNERADQTRAISNSRQVITTLKLYAADHEGKYPDAASPEIRSSNAAFRQMFVAQVADNELIFACPKSMCGTPDGNIGQAPDFRDAVLPDENHWAMTKGLTDSSDGKIPLVYENPQDATWPPKWSPDFAHKGRPGRTWSGGRVIIGMNDGSVSLMPLESTTGEHVGLKPLPDGKPVFPALNPKPEVLQIETRYH